MELRGVTDRTLPTFLETKRRNTCGLFARCSVFITESYTVTWPTYFTCLELSIDVY